MADDLSFAVPQAPTGADLNVPDLSAQIPAMQVPPLVHPAAPGRGSLLATIAALGAAAGLGGPAGANIARGAFTFQQQDLARRQQDANLENQRLRLQAQEDAKQAALQAVANQREAAIAQQRQQLLSGQLDKLRSTIPTIRTKAEYDRYVDMAGNALVGAGFRNWTPNQIRAEMPFVAPSGKSVASDAVTAWLKNPANEAAIKKDPSIIGRVSIEVDTNGDGIPERMPLVKAGQIAGIQFAADDQGQAVPIEGPPKIQDAFKELYSAQLEQFVAENKRQPTAKERANLVLKAKELASEAGRSPQDNDVPTLTPQGLDVAALMYAKTGQLPAMGQSKASAGVRSKIINRAAELYPNLDVAANRTETTTNQASLTQLQRQADALAAFEATAKKNLDVFLGTAGKVVDTGSPWLNRPLRSVARSGLGSADQAAYDVARRTVIPEFAKILANPGLSGQLSDSARQEVEGAMADGATFAQITAAAKVLMQDVENRRTSYNTQLSAIRSRVATKPGQTPTTTPNRIYYDENGKPR